MVPGPVKSSTRNITGILIQLRLGQPGTEYLDLYRQTEANLQPIFGTKTELPSRPVKACWRCGARSRAVLCLETAYWQLPPVYLGHGAWWILAVPIGTEIRTVALIRPDPSKLGGESNQAIIEFNPR